MFVQKNQQGNIIGLFVNRQPGYAEEELPDDHPEVLAFLNPPPTQDQLDAVAANQYAKLAALRGMTPAQVGAWIDANINNLADAKDALKTLAIAVSVLARRL